MSQQVLVDGVSGVRRWWLWLSGSLVLLFLIAPSFLVVVMSFSDSAYLEFPPKALALRWYANYFQSPIWLRATMTSLIVASAVTVVATLTGTAAAYGISRAGGRLARLIRHAILLPLIFPQILLAVGVFYIYVKVGLNQSMLGLILAHSVLAIPLVFIAVTSRLAHFDFNQELAARNLGASRIVAFQTVILPQIRFSLLTGGLLAFATSLDEIVVALFISGGASATLTKVMFVALRDQIDPTIAAVSTCLILASTLGFIASRRFR